MVGAVKIVFHQHTQKLWMGKHLQYAAKYLAPPILVRNMYGYTTTRSSIRRIRHPLLFEIFLREGDLKTDIQEKPVTIQQYSLTIP